MPRYDQDISKHSLKFKSKTSKNVETNNDSMNNKIKNIVFIIIILTLSLAFTIILVFTRGEVLSKHY
jgi:hypothetical protein